MNEIRYLFWDNDGVLVDTEHLYFQASAEILAEAGIALSRQQFIDISLHRGQSVFELAAPQTPEQVCRMRAARNHRYAELLQQGVVPMVGVRETLQSLHGRIGMAVVTSSHRDHFEIIHRQTGLLDFFDFVLTREDYNHSKPHPEPYLRALEISDQKARHCLVIEDSQRGLSAAVAAGLSCIMVPGEFNRHSDFSAARQILGHISELTNILGYS